MDHRGWRKGEGKSRRVPDILFPEEPGSQGGKPDSASPRASTTLRERLGANCTSDEHRTLGLETSKARGNAESISRGMGINTFNFFSYKYALEHLITQAKGSGLT